MRSFGAFQNFPIFDFCKYFSVYRVLLIFNGVLRSFGAFTIFYNLVS